MNPTSRQADLKAITDRLAGAVFVPTKRYQPPHQYIMTGMRPDYMDLWHDFRDLLERYGVERPFYDSKERWLYLDLPDGWTYWVMAQWVTPDWRDSFDPTDNHVLNRQRTEVATTGEWLTQAASLGR